MKDLDSEARTITIGVALGRDPNAHGPFHEALLLIFDGSFLPSPILFHRPNLDLHVLDPGLSFSPITFDYDGAQDLPTPTMHVNINSVLKDEPQ